MSEMYPERQRWRPAVKPTRATGGRGNPSVAPGQTEANPGYGRPIIVPPSEQADANPGYGRPIIVPPSEQADANPGYGRPIIVPPPTAAERRAARPGPTGRARRPEPALRRPRRPPPAAPAAVPQLPPPSASPSNGPGNAVPAKVAPPRPPRPAPRLLPFTPPQQALYDRRIAERQKELTELPQQQLTPARFDPAALAQVKAPVRDSNGQPLDWAWNDSQQLRSKEKGPDFAGEDTRVAKFREDRGWAEQSGSEITTRYERTPEEQEASRLRARNGKLVTAAGAAVTRKTGFVMGPGGAVHGFDGTDVRGTRDGQPVNVPSSDNGILTNLIKSGVKLQTTHHTTPLAGGRVGGAGFLLNDAQGRTTGINDNSGHYAPEAEYTYQTVKNLAALGVLDHGTRGPRDPVGVRQDAASANVNLTGYSDLTGGKPWVRDFPGHQGNLTLRYQQFLQTRGNERQARLKRSLVGQLESRNEEFAAGPDASYEGEQVPDGGFGEAPLQEAAPQQDAEQANYGNNTGQGPSPDSSSIQEVPAELDEEPSFDSYGNARRDDWNE